MSVTVEVTKGKYTAVDNETGAAGIGQTRAMALAALAARTRKRFEEEGITEANVEDGISWARSE